MNAHQHGKRTQLQSTLHLCIFQNRLQIIENPKIKVKNKSYPKTKNKIPKLYTKIRYFQNICCNSDNGSMCCEQNNVLVHFTGVLCTHSIQPQPYFKFHVSQSSTRFRGYSKGYSLKQPILWEFIAAVLKEWTLFQVCGVES